jgi:hypothetical protein
MLLWQGSALSSVKLKNAGCGSFVFGSECPQLGVERTQRDVAFGLSVTQYGHSSHLQKACPVRRSVRTAAIPR